VTTGLSSGGSYKHMWALERTNASDKLSYLRYTADIHLPH